jgi:hypothetical protein
MPLCASCGRGRGAGALLLRDIAVAREVLRDANGARRDVVVSLQRGAAVFDTRVKSLACAGAVGDGGGAVSDAVSRVAAAATAPPEALGARVRRALRGLHARATGRGAALQGAESAPPESGL